jgi:hypothetical protein
MELYEFAAIDGPEETSATEMHPSKRLLNL